MTILTGLAYRGRHRKPSHTGRNVATVAALGAIAFAGINGVSDAAEAPAAGPLDAIAKCESGGSYTAQNPRSSASGKYQFLDSTWQAMGGTGKARNASPAEQDMRAQKLLAQQGTSPWNASSSCWSGKTSTAAPKVKAKNPTKKRSAPSKVVTAGQRGPDGRGTYVCDTARLYFDACDPGNLGSVVNYPRYD